MEIVVKIKEAVANLNELVKQAEKEGLTVKLNAHRNSCLVSIPEESIDVEITKITVF